MGENVSDARNVQGRGIIMMWFSTVHDFITMHGYGRYVWPAWGVSLAVLLIQVVHARIERRRVIASLWRQQCRSTMLEVHTDASPMREEAV